MECKKQSNMKRCACTYPGCPRKGICCECIQHHVSKNQLPACCFPKEAEKTYDRSIEAFVRSRG
ncbi:cytosolic protein [Candidatus Woesearchaeota archaeon CG10_big_fil_rev_8_21_14_0_10_44_13]|nr:MAG: cytosolic protein [Candidatus Woesearchaeota archaeon CG10_big_fil_rev_8_21_14_0_10_44_13]